MVEAPRLPGEEFSNPIACTDSEALELRLYKLIGGMYNVKSSVELNILRCQCHD